MAGMLAHLLTRQPAVAEDDGPRVVKVETFAEAGAVGTNWPPHGVKVTWSDGATVFLACSRTSAPGEDLDAQPDVFDPEVLHVPGVRG